MGSERMPHLPHLLIALTHPTLTRVLLCQIQLIMIRWLMIFPIHHPNVVTIQSQKEKMKPSLYSININGVDSKIEEKFQQETKQLKKNIIGEFKAVGGTLPDGVDTLTPNEILNTFLTAESSVPLMSTMNRFLQSKGEHSTDHKEFGPLVRIINGLCYYTCSIVDVENHPNSHPIVTANVMSL